MRTFRALGLVILGVLVGIGAMAAGTRVAAQMGPDRLEVVSGLTTGDHSFQFIHDTRTNTCYLAALSHPGTDHRREITALAQADQMSCSKF